MYKYRIDAVAALELRDAGDLYESYFAELGDYEKGVEWADYFYREYSSVIERLKSNPFFYPVCNVYPFDIIDTSYRSFTCGWFTVFYTVELDSFTVWHIRSSKSDFCTLRRVK